MFSQLLRRRVRIPRIERLVLSPASEAPAAAGQITAVETIAVRPGDVEAPHAVRAMDSQEGARTLDLGRASFAELMRFHN